MVQLVADFRPAEIDKQHDIRGSTFKAASLLKFQSRGGIKRTLLIRLATLRLGFVLAFPAVKQRVIL